jgi:hypothetical protein
MWSVKIKSRWKVKKLKDLNYALNNLELTIHDGSCKPSTWEAGAGGSQVQSQPVLHRNALFARARARTHTHTRTHAYKKTTKDRI